MIQSSQFYSLVIRSNALKFSAAHMTVFSNGTKENLHGHNFVPKVTLGFERYSLDTMLPFRRIKEQMKVICAAWDEKLLLPQNCPFFKAIKSNKKSLEFELCEQRYAIPKGEVLLLPLENITTETLAFEFHRILLPFITRSSLRSLEVEIEEIAGQSGAFCQIFKESQPR